MVGATLFLSGISRPEISFTGLITCWGGTTDERGEIRILESSSKPYVYFVGRAYV